MTKMTSAIASKMLRRLNEDKDYYLSKEDEGSTYIAAIDEEPVIPEYNYEETAKQISDIDAKIVKIKHAINVANCTNEIVVGNTAMTVDTALVRMAQLNKRKAVLNNMRKQQPKSRVAFSLRKPAPEYQYINYDLALIKSEYEQTDAEISEIQIALDQYNQTVQFDVDV